MRHRPARGARDEAEPLLQRQIIDLVDDAVDVIAERRPLLFDGMILREHLRRGAAKLGQPKIGRQAEAVHGLDGAELGRSEGLAHFAPGVGEKLQGPLGGHARIELTQGASGKVARIGVDRLAGGRLARVERGKVGMAHVDFAARLEDLRRALKALWDRFDNAHVRGHVLAFVTVAARGRLDEFAILVAQAAGEAVDLGFRNDIERRAFAQAQKPPHAGAELLDFLIREDVAERQHRHAVADLGEFLRRRRADLAIGGVRIGKFGELPLRARCSAGAAHRIRRRKWSAHLAHDSAGRARRSRPLAARALPAPWREWASALSALSSWVSN